LISKENNFEISQMGSRISHASDLLKPGDILGGKENNKKNSTE
jgi:hypothetical protein